MKQIDDLVLSLNANYRHYNYQFSLMVQIGFKLPVGNTASELCLNIVSKHSNTSNASSVISFYKDCTLYIHAFNPDNLIEAINRHLLVSRSTYNSLSGQGGTLRLHLSEEEKLEYLMEYFS